MSLEVSRSDYDRYNEIYPTEKDQTLCAILKLNEFFIGNYYFEIIAFGFYNPILQVYLTEYGLVINRAAKIQRVEGELDGLQKAIEIYNGCLLMGAYIDDSFRNELRRALVQEIEETQTTTVVS